jgi:hypothetical protein
MSWRQSVAIMALAEAFSACAAAPPPLVELPPVSSVSSTPAGPLVGLNSPSIEYSTGFFKPFGRPTYRAVASEIYVEIYVQVGDNTESKTIGRIPVEDASKYVYDSLANHLASRGFDVVPMPRPSTVPIPPRIISVRLIDSQFHSNQDWTGAMATQLECNVQDSTGNTMFAKVYAASSPEERHPGLGASIKTLFSRGFRPPPGLKPEEIARNLAAAIDSAVVQLCDDPDFITALAPSPASLLITPKGKENSSVAAPPNG